MENSNLEDIVLFLVVTIFMSYYFLFILYKKNESLNSDLKELKNEHVDLKSLYNENIKKVNNKFKTLYSKVNTIPVVDEKIDKKVDELLKNEKKEIEKYVVESFKKVDKDILFESKIDQYSSKTISLKAILGEENGKYSNKLDNLFKAVQMFNSSIIESKRTIKAIDSDINKKLADIKATEDRYLEFYEKGKEARESIIKRIKKLENYQKEDESLNDGEKSDSSNTFNDDSFKIEKELSKSLGDLQMDEPIYDSDYKKRYR